MSTTDTPAPGTAPVLTVTWDTVIGARPVGEYEHDTGYQHYEEVSLGDAVVQSMAAMLLGRIQADADRIRHEALSRYRDEVSQQRTAAVTEEVARVVRETLHSEIQQTDGYGRPRGEPKVLIDLIREDVQTYLSETVPRQGYGDRERPGGFRALLRHEVDEAMTKDLRETIRAARADVAERVKTKAAELIGSVVQREV